MPPKKTNVKPKQAAKTGAAAKSTAKKATPASKSTPGNSNAKSNPESSKASVKAKWTPEDDAARIIQTAIRGFLARHHLARKQKEKQAYEDHMEKLQREAFAKLVKMEQEQVEKERQKEEEERRRKREADKRIKRILEAAFDGDIDEIKAILQEVQDLDDKSGVGTDSMGMALRAKHLIDIVDCEDANKTTPISEAAGGGHVDTIKLLIENGANPNSKGRFSRTPLYRASFAGHLDACQALLQHGADPRLYADDGQTPAQIAAKDNIRELFEDWDITQTDRLLAKIQADFDARNAEQDKRRAFERNKLEEQVEEAEKTYRAWQKKLCSTTEELNKRIFEHDSAAANGFAKPELTLQTIKDAESEVEFVKMEVEMARDHLSIVRLQLREQMKDHAEARGEELPGLKVTMRDLDEVLFRDVGNRIKDSGKWPMILDISGQSSIFLRYRDTNYLDALSPHNVEKEKVRMAVLGSLRYGKPLVVDMHEVDMFDQVSIKFDDVQKGLMNAIMDKSILNEEVYARLLRDSDGAEYNKNNFNSLRLDSFKFIIITKNPFPPEDLLERTYPIRIHIPI